MWPPSSKLLTLALATLSLASTPYPLHEDDFSYTEGKLQNNQQQQQQQQQTKKLQQKNKHHPPKKKKKKKCTSPPAHQSTPAQNVPPMHKSYPLPPLPPYPVTGVNLLTTRKQNHHVLKLMFKVYLYLNKVLRAIPVKCTKLLPM
mmetsp:Transcript_16698/g.24783  ORF Transcript_16698/g.24783 Transcript_16698/m.24783 type:complete len:145 (-) Transcript_16698:1552-1986(-)